MIVKKNKEINHYYFFKFYSIFLQTHSLNLNLLFLKRLPQTLTFYLLAYTFDICE